MGDDGLTSEQAVAMLDALSGDDPEVDHGSADAILLRLVPPAVAEAYERAADRVGFWNA